jgi:hypothetical protein
MQTIKALIILFGIVRKIPPPCGQQKEGWAEGSGWFSNYDEAQKNIDAIEIRFENPSSPAVAGLPPLVPCGKGRIFYTLDNK